MKKETLSWILRVAVALLFLISAASKLYPSPYFAISTFEVKQLYPMGFNGELAAYFSRTLIGIELALGFLLLQKNFLRTFIIPATVTLLAVFIFHLALQTYVFGNGGNCGCFGELLPMTPAEAILKNIAAIALLVWLFTLMPKRGETTHNFWVLTTVVLAFILLIFMLAPIRPLEQPIPTDISVSDSLEVEAVDTVQTPVIKTDTAANTTAKDTKKTGVRTVVAEPAKKTSGYAQYFADVDKGKTTLCFFVPGCDHCREAAKELTEMKMRNKNFPKIEIIFMNEEAEKIPEFFQFAGAAYPYKIIDVIPFWKVLGEGKDTPGVKYLWNGNEYVYYWGITDNKFSAAAYEKLVNKPLAELPKK